jgi:hypothetical protein
MYKKSRRYELFTNKFFFALNPIDSSRDPLINGVVHATPILQLCRQ